MIDVLYEHPRWFARLFAALDERGVPYRRVDAASLLFAPDWRHDPAARAAAPDLLVNRMSPSADRRGHGHGILPTLQYLESMEAGGVRVINGSRAYGFEISKARQMALLADMGLPIPKTRVINDASVAVAATAGLRWPVVVKPSVGGSGAGVRRVDSERELREAVETGQLDFGVDRLALVQEFIPARDNHITRVEVLDGRYLYAIHVPVTGQSFNLCPADHCELPPPGSAAAASADVASGAVALGGNCVVEPPAPARRFVQAHPPADIVDVVVRMTTAAGIEVGGVEYVIDDRDGQPYFYDLNALSNFVVDAPTVIGFDPWVPFVDFLVAAHDAARSSKE
ncbi:MAG: ATP-grasp domain-containing protein [Acidobacteria bacterium]|nr:ATP-grasp domain-containing protein [Acidobacteriota bacterium]